MGPRTRSGISRRLGDIAVLVQSKLTFLIFKDLCSQGQTVSDYHPLFQFEWDFWSLCYYNFKIFLDTLFCNLFLDFQISFSFCASIKVVKMLHFWPIKGFFEKKKKNNRWRFDFRGPKLSWLWGVDCYYVKSNCNKSCMSQGSEKSPAKNSESPMIHRNLLEKVVSEISWRR